MYKNTYNQQHSTEYTSLHKWVALFARIIIKRLLFMSLLCLYADIIVVCRMRGKHYKRKFHTQIFSSLSSQILRIPEELKYSFSQHHAGASTTCIFNYHIPFFFNDLNPQSVVRHSLRSYKVVKTYLDKITKVFALYFTRHYRIFSASSCFSVFFFSWTWSLLHFKIHLIIANITSNLVNVIVSTLVEGNQQGTTFPFPGDIHFIYDDQSRWDQNQTSPF